MSVRANIPFLAKVIEKVVTVHIHSYLEFVLSYWSDTICYYW